MNEHLTKQLAVCLALNCVRNTFLEELHAGITSATQSGDFSDVKVVTRFGEIPWAKVARLRDDELRRLMKEVVDKLYTALLRLDDPAFVERMDRYSRLMTRQWDEPKGLPDWFQGGSEDLWQET